MNNNFQIAKEILEKNGKITGLAFGNSMKPLLRSNKDNAVIVPLTTTPKVNDVILYKNGYTNELVLHRVIKSSPKGLVIRGDNVYYTERNVKNEDILGVLEGFYRNSKYYRCQNNLTYRIYILYIRLSYPLRRLFHKFASFIKIVKRKIKNQS